MNRSLWRASLTESYCPPYPCPRCEATIRLVKDSFSYAETRESKAARNHDEWDPEWIEYIFSASALCSNKNCQENFRILGAGGVGPSEAEEGWSYEDYFKSLYLQPMSHIIKISTKCPDDVKTDLVESFEVFWRHKTSCANLIRSALEKLLTHEGIPCERLSSKDATKMVAIPLHQRIETYSKSEPVIGSQLMALKWLGNAGSHGSKVNVDDLLDAFEILEHSLEEIVEKRSKKIANLAAKLTKKHS